MRDRVDLAVEGRGTAELHAALELALSQHYGLPRRITRLERRPSAYGSSFALEELAVALEDGTELELIFKALGHQALLEDARGAKPPFLCDPLREIETYRMILAREGLGTATCYGIIADDRAMRYWLFVEKIPGVELWQVGEIAIWQHVARWLAAMHRGFAKRIVELAQVAPLLRYDGDFYRLWPTRVLAFVERGVVSLPRATRRRIAWLAERYDRVIDRLLALPVTLIHGEFYPSNVLIQETADGVRVCPVDWEMAGLGPGLIDLAALTTGKWADQERKALALAYHAALPPDGAGQLSPEAFLSALDYCYLHVAMQWLGWSPTWSPPPVHAQDWAGEVLRLGERLEL